MLGALAAAIGASQCYEAHLGDGAADVEEVEAVAVVVHQSRELIEAGAGHDLLVQVDGVASGALAVVAVVAPVVLVLPVVPARLLKAESWHQSARDRMTVQTVWNQVGHVGETGTAVGTTAALLLTWCA